MREWEYSVVGTDTFGLGRQSVVRQESRSRQNLTWTWWLALAVSVQLNVSNYRRCCVKLIHKKLSGDVQQVMLITLCVYLIRPDGTKANHCPETIKLYACGVKSFVNYIILLLHPIRFGFFPVVFLCWCVASACHNSDLSQDKASLLTKLKICHYLKRRKRPWQGNWINYMFKIWEWNKMW